MLRPRYEGRIAVYGGGPIEKTNVGGKGEGFVLLEGMMPSLSGPARLEPLETAIITARIYARWMDNGGRFDPETLALLRAVHLSFNGHPLSVRPSEKDENEPDVPTSGENTSFMLPNNHPEREARFGQFLDAVGLAFTQFARKSGGADGEGVAIVVNRIHGVLDRTNAGPMFYPMSSGVATSIYLHCPGTGRPEEGCASVAFGHGYMTVGRESEDEALNRVLREQPLPFLTIANPRDTSGIREQRFFYAIGMEGSGLITEDGMGTMKVLSIGRADPDIVKPFLGNRGRVNFGRLIGHDSFGYASGLRSVMEELAASSPGHFQIEFVFNIDGGEGTFHIVQYKRLRDPRERKVDMPHDGNALISFSSREGIRDVLGHGTVQGISSVVAVSPFIYPHLDNEGRREARKRIWEINERMKAGGERYLLIVPGRLGSTNPEYGISVAFDAISNAAMVLEYGFDISGRGEEALVVPPDVIRRMDGEHLVSAHKMKYEEAVLEMRRTETGCTHFATNMLTAGMVYSFISPDDMDAGRAQFDLRLLMAPGDQRGEAVFVRRLERPVTAYADYDQQRCIVI
jgi:hypothetical protein